MVFGGGGADAAGAFGFVASLASGATGGGCSLNTAIAGQGSVASSLLWLLIFLYGLSLTCKNRTLFVPISGLVFRNLNRMAISVQNNASHRIWRLTVSEYL